MSHELKPEDITKPGWYYRKDDDQYINIEQIERLTYGTLRPRRGIEDRSMSTGSEVVLVCEGSTYLPDWGNIFYGPIRPPYINLHSTRTSLKDELIEKIKTLNKSYEAEREIAITDSDDRAALVGIDACSLFIEAIEEVLK